MDAPDPSRHIPTPGADKAGAKLGKVPKWAWIVGGAGAVGLLMLVEHRKQAQANAQQAADGSADPNADTAGNAAGAVDTSQSDIGVATGTSFPLSRGEAPIVVGEPPAPLDSSVNTLQLPPINVPVSSQLGPITEDHPVTGGGLPDSRPGRKKPPAKKGSANLRQHHTPAHRPASHPAPHRQTAAPRGHHPAPEHHAAVAPHRHTPHPPPRRRRH